MKRAAQWFGGESHKLQLWRVPNEASFRRDKCDAARTKSSNEDALLKIAATNSSRVARQSNCIALGSCDGRVNAKTIESSLDDSHSAIKDAQQVWLRCLLFLVRHNLGLAFSVCEVASNQFSRESTPRAQLVSSER